jgi:hypothetical protein
VAVGRPTGPVRALRSALPLLALALALLAPGPSAAQGLPPPVPNLVPFVEAYTAAWSAHDLEAVLALFAPDAAIAFDYGPSGDDDDGHAEYRGTAAPFSLRAGVAALMEAGVRVDPGGHQAAPVVFRGAPATLARWPYQRATVLASLPPELGTDAVVLRGGRILAYTRTPDRASLAARAEALAEAMSAVATRTAGRPAAPMGAAPPAAAATVADPTPVGWPLALGGLAGLAAVTAALRRRRLP